MEEGINTDFYREMMEKAEKYQEEINRLSSVVEERKRQEEKEEYTNRRIEEYWKIMGKQLAQISQLQTEGFDETEYLGKIIAAFRENYLPDGWDIVMINIDSHCHYVLMPK